jgi:hypothetical protein
MIRTYSSILKMGAIYSSRMLANYAIALYHFTEDGTLYSNHCENKYKINNYPFSMFLLRPSIRSILISVAKRKSLFNDRPAEIHELTYIIKEDLNSLNQQIAKLQEVARNQRQSQQNGHHLVSHSSSVVLTLQSKLASMSTEFKQVLEVRTEVCA